MTRKYIEVVNKGSEIVRGERVNWSDRGHGSKPIEVLAQRDNKGVSTV